VRASLRVALRALGANKLRTTLTMLGIVIGVAAVIALMSIGRGAQAQVTQQIQSLGTNLLFVRPGSTSQQGVRTGAGNAATLTLEDADAIATLGTVVEVAPEVQTGAQLLANGQNWSTRVLGVTDSYAGVRNTELAEGDWISRTQVEGRSSVLVLGDTVSKQLFPDGDPVGQTVRVSIGGRTGANFRVIGVAAPKGASGLGNQDDLVYVPITTVQARLFAQRTARGAPNVSTVNVQVVDERAMDETVAQIGELLRTRHRVAQDDFTIQSQQDFLNTFNQIAGTFTLLLGAIAGISLVVGGIGIMNIMLVSVTERTREIGIRKAVGARRKDILSQFLVESVVVSILGGAIGIGARQWRRQSVSADAGWPRFDPARVWRLGGGRPVLWHLSRDQGREAKPNRSTAV
jgi:putative ABC transport system permease protein